MEYTRETLIKRLGEYVGILPSELHDIACEAVELLERFDCSKGIRLINLDDAIEIISDQQDGSGTTYEILSHIIRDILLLPIFEAAQGEWVVTEHCSNAYGFRKWTEIECPFCGDRPVYEDIESMNYCPNCGAKMHKGGENE